LNSSAANDQRDDSQTPIIRDSLQLSEEVKEIQTSPCTTRSITKYKSHVFDMFSKIGDLSLVFELSMDDHTDPQNKACDSVLNTDDLYEKKGPILRQIFN